MLSLEVSRLCRDNAEWHKLLRIEAVSKTLILDKHGIYDVSELNDWMLLGLKVQLHSTTSRDLCTHDRRTAKQGTPRRTQTPLTIGFVYTERDRVVKDPDQSITEAVDLLFKPSDD